MTKGFYVDSCIYLNLWNKEISNKGKNFCNLAADFFKVVEAANSNIYFSGFILKELKFILAAEDFKEKQKLFYNRTFKRLIAAEEDYNKARKFESLSKFKISFFDCMHIVLSQKLDAVLVTRDFKLIEFAKDYCKVARPEELL